MKINRRYKRSIKNNMAFYVSSTILTLFALLLYLAFSIGGWGIKNFTDDFFKTQKLEDAQFITYNVIPDEDIERIEQEYDLVFEKEGFFEFEENDYDARILQRNSKINLHKVVSGKDAVNDNDIIISKGYADNKKVKIGDSLTINNKKYIVSGLFERPDYLFMLQNTTDSSKNVDSFFIAMVSDDEFKALGEPAYIYAVKYNKENSNEFRKFLNDKYKVVSYLSSDENKRISEVVQQPDTFISMSYFMLIIIPLIVVALISTIIGRMVKKEQKQIGTLMALGYKKWTIIRHYAGFAIIPGLIGSLLSLFIAALGAEKLGNMCLADYEPMEAKFQAKGSELVLCILIPSLIYLLASILTARKLLKKNVVTLLSGNSDNLNGKKKKYFVDSTMNFRKKLALRSILFNKSRSFVVFIGVFLGGFIVMFSLAFMDSLKSIGDKGGEAIGSFEYEYVMNYIMTDVPEDSEPVILTSFETMDDSSFYFMGINDDNKYIKIDDKSGKRISLGENDCIMTSLAAKIYGIDVGDTFKFKNGNTLDEYEYKITAISENSFQKCIYVTMENARELLNWEPGSYNALQSVNENSEIDNKFVNFTVTKESISDQMKNTVDQMKLIVGILIVLGSVICISSIYVAVNMLVDENKVNISMLKVLGYHKKEINRTILNTNNLILIIGIILSIPCAYLACNSFYSSMADSMGCIIPSIYNPVSMIATVMIVLLCYFVSLAFLKRKVYKIDVIESMKDNRE